jgi:hydroxymethylglutaryl-CoA lyase
LNPIADGLTCKSIVVREVGLREGFQCHPQVIPTEVKIAAFRGLVNAGFREINPVSLVSPSVMPMMADAAQLLDAIASIRPSDSVISVLVPNERGLIRAIELKRDGLIDAIILVFAESESVLKSNGMTTPKDAALQQMIRFIHQAGDVGLDCIAFISTAFGCSIEGFVDPAEVVKHAAIIQGAGEHVEVVISDSTGQADPLQVTQLLDLAATRLPLDRRIGFHFHDSRGTGLANAAAVLSSPFQNIVLDSAFGGWGGDVPFVPEAAGNLASEDLVEMLLGMGVALPVDVPRLIDVTRAVEEATGWTSESRVGRTGIVRWKRDRAVAAAAAGNDG